MMTMTKKILGAGLAALIFALIVYSFPSHPLMPAIEAQTGPRLLATHAPAVNTQATASVAANATRTIVADCIIATYTAGTAAPAATVVGLNLRDGATGAGTVLWAVTMAAPAAAGTMSPVVQLCGLNIWGTPNTAMTLEFNAAGGANTFESVALRAHYL